ncbi:MAG: hypothetical protein H0W65_06860 [Sphingomonas sp.]|uniref:hypothetical protein n=1 Tax=Sphingomonas sp. TaxID=28214 RepID=UPI00183604FD|nr:hypothetical protein [Sphingomonas sp.]MBA3667426.1 hypothetical protein [Sphingomonas sp.]
MSLYRTLALAACAFAAATPALALRPPGAGVQLALNDRPRDQDRAFRATQEGRAIPLPQIERKVMPHMNGADYLGPEFRGRSYRLKFMQEGRVIWVDVDAATGRIIGKSDR